MSRIGSVKFAQKPIYYLLTESKEEVRAPTIKSAKNLRTQDDPKKKIKEDPVNLILKSNKDTQT